MSKVSNVSSGNEIVASGDNESIELLKKSVQALEAKNAELLDEKRKASEKHQAALNTLADRDKKDLESKGQYQELATKYQQEANDLKKALDDKEKAYGWNVISGSIKTAAIQKGCIAPDDLLKTLERSDLERIKIGKNFEIDLGNVDTLITEIKSKKHYLFKTEPVKINDVNPVNQEGVKSKTINDLPKEEIEKLLKNRQFKK